MMDISRARILLFCSVAALAMLSFVTACADDAPANTTGGNSDTKDSSTPNTDDTEEAAGDDAGPSDELGKTGTECAFNRDCQAALRCECSEDTGCSCQPGARGTGKNGVDTCTSGNDCASSLCVEGPDDGGTICSDECADNNDCTGKLPKCLPVPTLGKICARETPK
jgi:hypothetical protein